MRSVKIWYNLLFYVYIIHKENILFPHQLQNTQNAKILLPLLACLFSFHLGARGICLQASCAHLTTWHSTHDERMEATRGAGTPHSLPLPSVCPNSYAKWDGFNPWFFPPRSKEQQLIAIKARTKTYLSPYSVFSLNQDQELLSAKLQASLKAQLAHSDTVSQDPGEASRDHFGITKYLPFTEKKKTRLKNSEPVLSSTPP